MKYYGIEVVKNRYRNVYRVVEVTENGLLPVGYGKSYRTEADARRAAESLGCKVVAVGDCSWLWSRLANQPT